MHLYIQNTALKLYAAGSTKIVQEQSQKERKTTIKTESTRIKILKKKMAKNMQYEIHKRM